MYAVPVTIDVGVQVADQQPALRVEGERGGGLEGSLGGEVGKPGQTCVKYNWQCKQL